MGTGFYHPAPTYLSLNIIQYILSSEVYNTKLHNKFQSVVVALHFFCYTAHIIVHSINTTCHCTHGMCCCFFDSRILLYHGANLSKTNCEVEEAGGVNNHTVQYHDSTIGFIRSSRINTTCAAKVQQEANERVFL